MTIFPHSTGSSDLEEINYCHQPAGRPEGGQFAPKGVCGATAAAPLVRGLSKSVAASVIRSARTLVAATKRTGNEHSITVRRDTGEQLGVMVQGDETSVHVPTHHWVGKPVVFMHTHPYSGPPSLADLMVWANASHTSWASGSSMIIVGPDETWYRVDVTSVPDPGEVEKVRYSLLSAIDKANREGVLTVARDVLAKQGYSDIQLIPGKLLITAKLGMTERVLDADMLIELASGGSEERFKVVDQAYRRSRDAQLKEWWRNAPRKFGWFSYTEGQGLEDR